MLRGKSETGAGEGADGIFRIEGTLQHARAVKGIDGFPELFLSLCVGEHQFGFSRAGNPVFRGPVQIPKGMAGNGDGFYPGAYKGTDTGGKNGGAEDSPVQNGTDGAVGTFPHLFQVIFLHSLCIGGDGGAFDAHMVAFDRLSGLGGHPVIGGVPVGQAQIVVVGA